MTHLVEVCWAAGFLEGEGCVQVHRSSPVLDACQVDPIPLERLQALFGGTICLTGRKYHKWSVCGPKAAAAMMTVYTLLTPRRQEAIRGALEKWRSVEGRNFALSVYGICPTGGIAHRVRKRQGGKRHGRNYCVDCARDYRRGRYENDPEFRSREQKRSRESMKRSWDRRRLTVQGEALG